MADLLLPADVEQAAIDALSPAYVVGTKIPTSDPKPSTFVRVLGAGGFPQTMVSDVFTLTVEVYATKESVAHQAAARVLAELQACALTGSMGSEVCHRVDVSGLPQNYPNPTVPGYARYTMTLAPVLRRRTIN